MKYVEDPEIRSMRIRAWFRLVSVKSGLVAGELEQQFANVPREGKSRSCIWDKYRRGEVVPSRKPSHGGLVERVEGRYPGTAFVLTSPIWRLADKAPMEMFEVRHFYEHLPKNMRDAFVAPEATKTSVFWRRPIDTEELCPFVLRFRDLDTLIALLLMLKEAETAQLQYQHEVSMHACLSFLESLGDSDRLLPRSVARELAVYLKARWSVVVKQYIEIRSE